VYLELANISVQFIIFPLYSYGINNYWAKQAAKEAEPEYVKEQGEGGRFGTGEAEPHPDNY
jgi:hypothetical protein